MKFRYELLLVLVLCACGEEFLDVKRNARQVVPKTIVDYQALLDEPNIMNSQPSVTLGIIGSDEYYLLNGRLSTLRSPYQRNGYIWADNVYEEQEDVFDWNYAYQRILYANIALDVDKITPSAEETSAWNNVKGSALFHRAYNHYLLAQLFCNPYKEETAATDAGIPLRLDYDVSESPGRGTLESTYMQIINDLKAAVNLLPATAAHAFRPCKASACVLLARVYLQMDDYAQAGYYADLGLQTKSELIDFNTLDLEKRHTFQQDYGAGNPEILYYWSTIALSIVSSSRLNVDSNLLKLYAPDDLRLKAYFHVDTDGRTVFKGSYSGDNYYFNGLTTSELWLARAECHIRTGEIELGMGDLNVLLRHRCDTESFVPVSARDQEDALQKVLHERRKELYMRGIRWEDMRRLNKDARFATTLVRQIDGQRYELPPNDPKWVWPLPVTEVEFGGLRQNER